MTFIFIKIMSEIVPKEEKIKDDSKWSGGLIAGCIILFIFIPLIVVLVSYVILSVVLYEKRQKRKKEIEEAKNYLFTELK